MKTKLTTILAALALAGTAFAYGPAARLATPVKGAKAPEAAPARVAAACPTMVVPAAPLLKTDGVHRVKDCTNPAVYKTAECKRACERR
jgi:hypothetical protein